jgi:hypothetical protein
MTRTLSYLVPFVLAACESFDAPPEASLDGAPVLSDPSAPLVVRFQKPVVRDSLRLEVVPYDVDLEGNLADEVSPAGDLQAYFTHDPSQGEYGGTLAWDDDDTVARIMPSARLPTGRRLAILIEPGLSDRHGAVTRVRDRLLFSYDFECTGRGTKILPSGPYFFLINVESPVSTQIQLFGQLRVDAANGRFVGQFTNADRNLDGSRCGGTCTPIDACRTVPAMECVAPSLRAAGVDEFVDFVPNVTPPTGYSFTVQGCAEDQGDTVVAMATAPVDLVVQQPAVTARALVVRTSFEADASGALRGTGTGTADQIVLGTKEFGAAKGTVQARNVPIDRLPPGVPLPP